MAKFNDNLTVSQAVSQGALSGVISTTRPEDGNADPAIHVLTSDQITRVLDLRRAIAVLKSEVNLIIGEDELDTRLLLTCYRCGFRWRTQFEARVPKRCSRCKSTSWNRPEGITRRVAKAKAKVTRTPKDNPVDHHINRYEKPDGLPQLAAVPWTSAAPPPPLIPPPLPHPPIFVPMPDDAGADAGGAGETIDSQIPQSQPQPHDDIPKEPSDNADRQ